MQQSIINEIINLGPGSVTFATDNSNVTINIKESQEFNIESMGDLPEVAGRIYIASEDECKAHPHRLDFWRVTKVIERQHGVYVALGLECNPWAFDEVGTAPTLHFKGNGAMC